MPVHPGRAVSNVDPAADVERSLTPVRRARCGRRFTAWAAGLAVLVAGVVVAPAGSAAAEVKAEATPAASQESFQRPDVVSARLAAQATGKDILVTGETSATSLTYASPDGSMRSEVSPVPVRVAQADGSWADVDYGLHQVGGGWAPKVSPAAVVFSAGGDGPAVTLASGSRRFGLSWAKSLPAPTIDGASAVYQLTDTEALVLTATSDGFEQSLKLTAAPTAAPKLRLGFDMTGLTMVANTTGGYDFAQTDAGGAPTSTVVFTMPAPQMFSSQMVDDEHTQIQSVPVTLATDTDGSQYLDLTAGMPFLADPATVYPVWIDPSVSSVSRYGDTYVSSADAVSHAAEPNLQIGLSTGGYIRRSLIRFNTLASVPAGSHVTSAVLKLYNHYSGTCTGRAVYAYPLTESWTSSGATWDNQPSINTSYVAGATWSYGNESLGCANGTGQISVVSMVQAWVSGTLTDYGLQVRAASESDDSYRKSFCSMNLDTTGTVPCTTTATDPTISVVYNSYPGVPASGTFSPKVSGTTTDSYLSKATVFSTSATPTFTAKLSNKDGAKVALQVKLSHDVNYTAEGSGEITTMTSASVNPGANASVTVPSGTLSGSTHVMYQMRARVTNGAGGYDYSAWTPSSLTSTTATKLALNTGLPVAPTITCGTFPASIWTSPPATTTSCTFDTTSTDGAGYYWGLDDPATPNLANDSSNAGAAVTVSSIPTKVLGWHTLYVRSRDTALHLSSTTTSYEFGVGAGGVLSPAAGASTAKGVALSASANSGYIQVTYQWAPGTTSSTWTDLPVGDVTPAGSSTAISAWPLTGTTSGNLTSFAGYNWNVAATLAAAGQPDGALRIRAKFVTSTGTVGYSAERVFVLAVATFGQDAATEVLGPGEVSLTTGDFEVTAGDSSAGGLGIGRTATSLAPAAASTGPSGIFGAGWRASLPGARAGAGAATLIDNSVAGSVTIQYSDGTEAVYVKQSSGTYVGVGAANDGSVLAKSTSITNPANSADTTVYSGWQLTGADGTVTTWTKSVGGVWAVAWVDQVGQEGETSFARDANGRVTTILGAAPTGVTCTVTSFNAAGCSAVQITYASSTTATGTAESTWGDYSGLVSGISWTGYDPAVAAMVSKQVSAYLYDSTGHLRAAWDPRLPTPLKTKYSYDSTGRIATITPPGQNPWTLAYDGRGRLAGVSRTDPANGTATQAVAYDLGVSGVASAPDVSGSTAAAWGQVSDLAYSGAAVFPASHVPSLDSSSGAYTPGEADWPYADVTYADVNGTVVDTAAYGAGAWQIDSTRYDDNGNEIWALDAGSRAQALTPTADTDPYVAAQASSVARADLLATISTYTDDGVELVSTLGGAHPADLSSEEVASIRVKTTYTYDTGAPTTDPYHLVTKTVTTPIALDGTTVTAADTNTTVTGYDPIDGASSTGDTSGWTLYKPTTQTTWMGTSASASADLVSKTRYDSSGRTVESRLPGGAATDPNTAVSTYYTTAANSTYPTCGGKPYWAGQVCRIAPGGSPSSGYAVPVKLYTYNLYGQVLTVTETSGSVTRTTTMSYDTAGRPLGSSTAVSGLSTSTAVTATAITYNADTGVQTATTQGSATTSTSHDALGRQLTYVDADGATSTYTYDIDGNIKTINDGKGTSTATYDSATEHRGLVTAMDTGIGDGVSTFTGVYDAAGQLTTQTYPNGMTASYSYDNLGTATAIDYTLPTYSGATAGTLSFTAVTGADGHAAHTESPLSAQDLTYDNAGRLTQVEDSVAGACTTRAYTYTEQSERTSLTTYAAADDGTCQTSTASSTATNTYDTANRITNNGYTYDQLGRSLTVPEASLASGSSALSVAYYDNDMPATMTQGSDGKTFTLDPQGRYRQVTDTTSGTETGRIINHYANTTDSPSWIASSTDDGSSYTWQRNVLGIGGGLAAVQSSDGSSVLQVVNLHGDVVATVPNHVPTASDTTGASTSAYFESTEYGISRDASLTPRYGWLGAAQRSSDALGALTLMGVRLYNASNGRFLSTDPVYGGNDNSYNYPTDPIGQSDLSGRFKRVWHWWGLEVRYTKGETATLAHWLWEYPQGAAQALGGWIGGYVMANAKKGVVAALLNPIAGFVILAALLEMGIGKEASIANDAGRCLRVNLGWQSWITWGSYTGRSRGCK